MSAVTNQTTLSNPTNVQQADWSSTIFNIGTDTVLVGAEKVAKNTDTILKGLSKKDMTTIIRNIIEVNEKAGKPFSNQSIKKLIREQNLTKDFDKFLEIKDGIETAEHIKKGVDNLIDVVDHVNKMRLIIGNDKLTEQEKIDAFQKQFEGLKVGMTEITIVIVDSTFGSIPIFGPYISKMAEIHLKPFLQNDFEKYVNAASKKTDKLIDLIATKTGFKDWIIEKAQGTKKVEAKPPVIDNSAQVGAGSVAKIIDYRTISVQNLIQPVTTKVNQSTELLQNVCPTK